MVLITEPAHHHCFCLIYPNHRSAPDKQQDEDGLYDTSADPTQSCYKMQMEWMVLEAMRTSGETNVPDAVANATVKDMVAWFDLYWWQLSVYGADT